MTTTSPPAASPGPTTSTLIDLAVAAGIRVYWTPPSEQLQAAYAHAAQTIWLRRDLTDAEVRSLLAHELGHHHYGDVGPQPPRIEARAWRWAARLLLTDGVYASAEELWPQDPAAIADELGVTTEIVHAYAQGLGAAA